MARYAQGDDSAFSQLFARLAPRVRGFFFRSFSDTSVADDLTQTTFLKLHAARASYRPGLPLRPWLFKMAADVRSDELRRRYRLPAQADEEEIERSMATSGEPEEVTALDHASEVDAVRAAVGRLPESLRLVVHLHRYENLTFEQIAAVLGTTPGAVRVRASRAYERLRRDLRLHLAKSR
jgi:RNA polymerase sigma-70 factor (ECF subfamily)